MFSVKAGASPDKVSSPQIGVHEPYEAIDGFELSELCHRNPLMKELRLSASSFNSPVQGQWNLRSGQRFCPGIQFASHCNDWFSHGIHHRLESYHIHCTGLLHDVMYKIVKPEVIYCSMIIVLVERVVHLQAVLTMQSCYSSSIDIEVF